MRKEELERHLAEKMRDRKIIIGAGADTPEQEILCVRSRCDFILLYPTSAYASSGNRFLAGFLAFGSVNRMMEEMLDLIPVMLGQTHLAAYHATDPFLLRAPYLRKLRESRIMGIHNYPTLALIDGDMEANLESLDFSFSREMKFMEEAAGSSLFRCIMVRTQKQAVRAARSGADLIVFYLGLGRKDAESDEENRKQLENDADLLRQLSSQVRNIRKDLPLLFCSEQERSVHEIGMLLNEAPDVNGCLLLPFSRTHLTGPALRRFIEQLQTLRF